MCAAVASRLVRSMSLLSPPPPRLQHIIVKPSVPRFRNLYSTATYYTGSALLMQGIHRAVNCASRVFDYLIANLTRKGPCTCPDVRTRPNCHRIYHARAGERERCVGYCWGCNRMQTNLDKPSIRSSAIALKNWPFLKQSP